MPIYRLFSESKSNVLGYNGSKLLGYVLTYTRSNAWEKGFVILTLTLQNLFNKAGRSGHSSCSVKQLSIISM